LRHDIGKVFRDPQIRSCWLRVCFNAGTVFTVIACSPLIGQMFLGLSPAEFGLWAGMGALGYVAGNFLARRAATDFRAEHVLAAGAFGVVITCARLTIGFAAELRSPWECSSRLLQDT